MHKPIKHPADWLGADLQDSQEWITLLTPDETREVRQAFEFAKKRGKTLETLTREDFPLPTVSKRLAEAEDYLENGRGVRLIRGFPADPDLTKDDQRLIYWGLGKYLGTAVTQSRFGDLIGDVKDHNLPYNAKTRRGYTSNGAMGFHTDSADVSALYTVSEALEGGESYVVSSLAVHNEIARTRPDLLEVLYQPFYVSWMAQEPEGEKPWYLQPIYSIEDGKFCCKIVRGHLRAAQMMPDVPKFTDIQEEALALIPEISQRPEYRLSFLLKRGDLELLNSHVTFHARAHFEDGEGEYEKRHLLRMWLSVPNSRPLNPAMATFYRDVRPGAVRGGFPAPANLRLFETRVTLD